MMSARNAVGLDRAQQRQHIFTGLKVQRLVVGKCSASVIIGTDEGEEEGAAEKRNAMPPWGNGGKIDQFISSR